MVVLGFEDGKDVGECGDEGLFVAVGHGSDDDGVDVVDVCHKYVLYVLE